MALEGEFPKTTGNIVFAKDANVMFYNALNSDVMNYGAVTIDVTATVIKAA